MAEPLGRCRSVQSGDGKNSGCHRRVCWWSCPRDQLRSNAIVYEKQNKTKQKIFLLLLQATEQTLGLPMKLFQSCLLALSLAAVVHSRPRGAAGILRGSGLQRPQCSHRVERTQQGRKKGDVACWNILDNFSD